MSAWVQRGLGEGSQEDQEITAGLAEATHPGGLYEYGVYVERFDGDEWVPLIYGELTLDEARSRVYGFSAVSAVFRRVRVTRRFVSPWEVEA